MARTPKPVTWYMATPADGIIQHSRQAGTPVSLADAVGQVIDHPNPCRTKWFDETDFSYFRMVKRVGEALEDTGIWPVTWPVRLWIVEPVGDTGNWSQHHYPYRLLAHQIRVVEETDAWQALGAGGREVLEVIEHEIPERAPGWAADWDADPEGMRERRWNWHLSGGRNSGSGMWAQSVTHATARARREYAAQRWNQRLAGETAERVLAASGASPQAVTYAWSRAADLATAAQHQTHFDAYVLDTLRGADLDNSVPAAA
ncbi:hypothetical protein ACIP4U_36275 [Streptomyces caelestis]|uniref:hypothetical protein n=1 Tax=Streptomyces caelestis TaxID=36816 RepID=UPI0038235B58